MPSNCADDEDCSYPKCSCYKPVKEFKALEPPVRPVATTTLAGYIQRVVEAEKGLPEYKMVDVSAVHFVMDVLYHRKETLYLAELLKKVLDNAGKM